MLPPFSPAITPYILPPFPGGSGGEAPPTLRHTLLTAQIHCPVAGSEEDEDEDEEEEEEEAEEEEEEEDVVVTAVVVEEEGHWTTSILCSLPSTPDSHGTLY
jgi:hypothetical protein